MNIQIVLPSFNTTFIDAEIVDKVAMMTEHKRASFIESFCGSSQVVAIYDQLLKQIDKVKLDLDSSIKDQKGLKADKKMLQKDIETTKKRSVLIENLKDQLQQFDLFKMFHNNKFVEASGAIIESQKEELNNVKQDRTENLTALQENAQREALLKGQQMFLDIRLDKMADDLKESQYALEEVKTKIDLINYQKTTNDDHQKSIETCQEKIHAANTEIKRLIELEEHKNDLMKHHAEYEHLKNTFRSQNFQQFCLRDVMRSLSREVDYQFTRNFIKQYTESADKVKAKIDPITLQIERLEVERQKKMLCKSKIEELLQTVESRKQSIAVLEKSIEKTETVNKEKLLADSHSKILKELKREIPEGIMGCLSEYWEISDDASESEAKFIKRYMKEFTNAIVVDTQETADECIEFLKIRPLTPIEAIFLPLSEIVEQKSSISFLKGDKLPNAPPCKFIEDLVTAKTDDIAKVLLSCLKPSIVTESLDDAEMLLKWEGAKMLNVVSTDALTIFHKQGFLEKFSVTSDECLSNIELEDARKNLSEEKQSFMICKLECEKKILELESLKRDISSIDIKMKTLEMSIEPFERALDYNMKKVTQYQNELEKMEQDEPLQENRRNFAKVEETHEQSEREFYKDFCATVGVESIEKYLDKIEQVPSTEIIKTKIKFLKSEKKDLEEQKKYASEQIVNVDSSDLEAEMVKIQQTIADKTQKLDLQLQENVGKEREMFELLNEIHQNEKIDQEFTQQIFDAYENIYDNLHRVHKSFQDNYEILTRNFLAHQPLELKSGSIMDFIMIPNKISADFDLVRDQLKKADVNFGKLKKSLKGNIDVAEKTLELNKKLQKLQESIDSTTGKILDDVDEQRVLQVTEGLKAISEKVSLHRLKFNKIEEKLQEAKDERKRVFLECLKVIHEGVEEFYHFAYNGHVAAFIEVSNMAEPYLGEIILSLSTEDSILRITERNADYVAALALLFGIVKYKKQRLVVLDNAMKKVAINLHRFFKHQNSIQIVSFTTNVSGDDTNFQIRRKGASFIVTTN